MAFPIPTNTTCDIYHGGNAPPNPPDIAAVRATLTPAPRNLKANQAYTHWIELPLGTDIRSGDTVYVPDQNGTAFKQVAIERIRFASGNDYKRMYLNRQAVNWPSQNL
jgi:hypothetical protein